jgi:2-oxoisovalerate dehydrogenase E1 component
VSVLDLRTIMPYDWKAIETHVRRTKRVIVVHEDQLTCGFGAEIAARISEELFYQLDAPVKRIGASDTPLAYSSLLEQAILPQTTNVLRAIREISAACSGTPPRTDVECTVYRLVTQSH